MFTNVFRIGGLQQVSWFQFLAEGDVLPASNFARKQRYRQDMAAMHVMRAHMWLQETGKLSSWTLSDDKVKLWLFLPGRHDSLNSTVLAAVSGLKVVGSGLWRAPGECSEIGYALDQALRNRIEKGFKSVSYVRFGDVFVKCLRQSTNEVNLRKSLFSCELVFTSSNDAIFVHVLVRRKRVRQLVISDLQAALAQQRSNAGSCEKSLAVIVAPNGLSARLTGCSPDDLVTQLYKSKSQAYEASSLPFHVVGSAAASGSPSVQPCFAEVILDHLTGYHSTKSTKLSTLVTTETKVPRKGSNGVVDTGHVLIYPLDAVLVPMRPVVPSHPFIRRCWFQEWAGTTWLEDGAKDVFRPSTSKYGLDDGDSREKSTITGFGANGSVPGHSSGPGTSSNSSGGSSSSSQGSSGTSSSSDADGDGLRDVEADGDSLGSKAPGVLNSKHNDMRAPATSLQVLEMDTVDMKGSHGAYSQGTKRGRLNTKVAAAAAFDPPAKALKRSNSIGNDVLGGLLDTPTAEKKGTSGFLGESSFGGALSGGGSQLGNAWDAWNDDGGFGGMGLGGMDIQSDADILAEFGDFGDFFEDDALGFGEPPDTAESQALNMFSLNDYSEVNQTPGTAPLMDASDPMVLPIVDFPLLEMNQSMDLSDMKPFLETSQVQLVGGHAASSPPPQPPALNLRLKNEALLCFASGFEPVDVSSVPDVGMAAIRNPYVPFKKVTVESSAKKETTLYTATPITYTKFDRVDTGKDDHGSTKSPNESGESKRKKELTADYIMVSSSRQANANGKPDDAGLDGGAVIALAPADAAGGGNGPAAQSPSIVKHNESTKSSSLRSPVAALATELECALLKVSICRDQDSSSSVSGNSGVGSPANETAARFSPMPSKDSGSDITQVHSDTLAQSARPHRKKVPERIAGHAEDDLHDGGSRVAEVGVWRPVGAPRPSNNTAVEYRLGVSNTTSPTLDPAVDDSMESSRQNHWHEVQEAIPLLAQQASIAVDVCLDGQYEDGPFKWLASQEVQKQQRKRRSDGSMVASSRFLDQSGMEIMDPLSAEISAATAASLLQSDVRVAISNAFGYTAADGPLGLVDWCKGCVLQGSDATAAGICAESTNTDSREVNSTVTAVGESMTPQSGKGSVDMDDLRRNSSSSRVIDSSSLSDQTEASQRRGFSEGSGVTHGDALVANHESPILALPTPALLVGYQDDWLKTSSGALHLWEKAPLEPYAAAKQINYHVLCLASEPLLTAAVDFFQQLSAVYEVCRLGSHMPLGAAAAGQSVPMASSSKQMLPGFTLVDTARVSHSSAAARGEFFNASNYSLAKAFAADMSSNWNMSEFRKNLVKVCKELSLPSGSQREPEQGPCTVVYVVCPVSDPAGILQTMVDACSSLGSALLGDRHTTSVDDGLPSSILGFSIPRFALQLITAETIFKSSGPQASTVDVLKEIALGVYNKVRRIPRKSPRPAAECNLQISSSGPRAAAAGAGSSVPQSNAGSLTGLWKDCSGQRSSSGNTSMAVNTSGNNHMWEGGWKPSMQTDLGGAGSASPETAQEKTRYVYEPAYILARSGAQAPARGGAGSSDATLGVGTSGAGGSNVVDSSTAAMERLEDPSGASGAQLASDLHCCYTWSADWNWLVSVWTDARGELLDTQVLPLNGVDVNGLHSVLEQVLQQGLQLLNLAVDAGSVKPRGLSITRLGGFFVRECQEWHRVIMSAGAEEVRKWPVQIRHPECHVGGTGSSSDMGLMTDRGLGLAGSGPTSPSPSSSSFGGRGNKSSLYNKPGASDLPNRRPNQAAAAVAANPTASSLEHSAFRWVNSISLVSVRADHSLQIVSTNDGALEGISSSGPSTSGSSGVVVSMGVSTVKTLASTGAAYLVMPSHANRPLTTSIPPSDIVSNASPVAQCLQQSGLACPVTTAFCVSTCTSSGSSPDFSQRGMKEAWPSTLAIGLVAHYSATRPGPDSLPSSKQQQQGFVKATESSSSSSKDQQMVLGSTLQAVASELHALSWLNVGLTYVHRRSPLPFHCEVAQRLQRLLDFLSFGAELCGM